MKTKPKKKRKFKFPKGLLYILMPKSKWESMANVNADGIVVGFRTLQINGIPALPCSFVDDICFVIKGTL